MSIDLRGHMAAFLLHGLFTGQTFAGFALVENAGLRPTAIRHCCRDMLYSNTKDRGQSKQQSYPVLLNSQWHSIGNKTPVTKVPF